MEVNMDFLELAQKRYLIKSFKNVPVEDEKIIRILEAGRLASSITNAQPIHFILIKEKESLEEIYSTYSRDWVRTAPIIIAICADETNVAKHKDGTSYGPVDVAIAINQMTLAATELGLGTCWIATFDKIKVAELLQTPKGIIPLFLLPIGYFGDNLNLSRHNTRKPMSDILHYNKF
jgi:nitroreductase